MSEAKTDLELLFDELTLLDKLTMNSARILGTLLPIVNKLVKSQESATTDPLVQSAPSEPLSIGPGLREQALDNPFKENKEKERQNLIRRQIPTKEQADELIRHIEELAREQITVLQKRALDKLDRKEMSTPSEAEILKVIDEVPLGNLSDMISGALCEVFSDVVFKNGKGTIGRGKLPEFIQALSKVAGPVLIKYPTGFYIDPENGDRSLLLTTNKTPTQSEPTIRIDNVDFKPIPFVYYEQESPEAEDVKPVVVLEELGVRETLRMLPYLNTVLLEMQSFYR